jgi:hypothetical protein
MQVFVEITATKSHKADARVDNSWRFGMLYLFVENYHPNYCKFDITVGK